MTSKLNDLKSQHIATEVKSIDDKTKKNASDILGFESRLKQKEDIVDEVQRENSADRGFRYYIDKSYVRYECRIGSFTFSNGQISTWKSTGVFNYLDNSTLTLPTIENNGRINVKLSGNYFVQNKVIHPNDKNIVNIYVLYKLDTISSLRNTDYTIQNALFGAMNITKNADISKNVYKGYVICFYEGGTFSKGNINNGKHVLIFGVDESSLVHANNKANNIYVTGDLFVQGINDTTLYAEKVYSQNFTEPGKKFVLSLHYNFSNSYLFVNGKQELKFKAKTSSIIKEKLCLGNLSSEWTTDESTKTGLYGSVYDFVVDYHDTDGVKTIYDIYRYLMDKHNIR